MFLVSHEEGWVAELVARPTPGQIQYHMKGTIELNITLMKLTCNNIGIDTFYSYLYWQFNDNSLMLHYHCV